MTRSGFHVLLVSVLTLQPLFAVAQEVSFGSRLDDISGEVERFVECLPESERAWARRGVDAEQNEQQVEQARLRVRIQNLPLGTKISVVTRSGDRLTGELREAAAEEFVLVVDHIVKRLRYEEIEAAELPAWKGWRSPASARGFEDGQKVELLLVDGTKVKGKLVSLSADAWVLGTDGDEQQRFAVDTIASVRKVGMSGWTKAAIIAGVAGGTLLILGAIVAASWDGGGWSGGLL